MNQNFPSVWAGGAWVLCKFVRRKYTFPYFASPLHCVQNAAKLSIFKQNWVRISCAKYIILKRSWNGISSEEIYQMKPSDSPIMITQKNPRLAATMKAVTTSQGKITQNR